MERGVEVLAIDKDAERIQRERDLVAQSVVLDATDAEALEAAGVRELDAAIVATGAGEASVLITAILKEFEVPTIVVRATSELHARILKKLGATRVVFPAAEMGQRLGNLLVEKNLLDYYPLSEDYVVAELRAREDWIDRTLTEIRFRNEYGVNVVALRHCAPDDDPDDAGSRHYFAPDPTDLIREGDALLVAGSRERISKLVDG